MRTLLQMYVAGSSVVIGLALAAGCDKSAAAGGSAPTAVIRGAPISKAPEKAPESENATKLSSAPDAGVSAAPTVAAVSGDASKGPSAVAPTETTKKPPAVAATATVAGTNGNASAKPDFSTLRPAIKKPKDDMTPVGTPDKERPEYLRIDFDELASYDYDPYEAMPPDLGAGPKAAGEEYAAPSPAPVKNAQVPPRILALNKKKVIITGFMVPIEFKRDSVRSFLLVRIQMMCCFGAMIGMNEWVMVQMDGEKRTTFVQDVPTTVYGELDAGEDIENGMVMSLYRLRGLEVQFKGGR